MKSDNVKIKEMLFTGFYSGYVPLAPGTAGTFVGMIFYFLEYLIFGPRVSPWVNVGVAVILLYPAIKLGDAGELYFGKKDPQEVVLDEMMGYWITMMFLPFSIKLSILGFILFRIMDVLKPYPAGKLQELKGGLGIMIDDYIAGVYACIILHAVLLAADYCGIIFL
ncbi:MAG: phosphatidylglycerophosphatase A [Spirochaetae bacterium HGW-Spirochaetae-1]|nr:MAG: phosphatidylglycerophosphatase A [Spirochaetae bacterium HGW-Spirochaetae-1]